MNPELWGRGGERALVGPISETPGGVFICYRRQETAYAAAWLYDRLRDRFGPGQVFKDVDNIEPGDDFFEKINTAVGSCDVLLALIGTDWLTMNDDDGHRRLSDPADFVRLEIEAALARQVRVVPLLISGARMPRGEQLPESMAGFARRHALELTPARFEADTDRLLGVLERTLAEVQAARDDLARTAQAARAPVAEPVAPEPVAPEPVAPEPVAPEPVAPEPVAREPVAPEQVAREPVAPEPVAPQPLAVTDRPAPEPPRTPVPEPGVPAPRISWWAVLAIAAGAAVLILANRPIPQGLYAWKDVDTGFYVHRTWYDPYILGSILVLLAAAGARWSSAALGAAIGGAAFLVAVSLVFLISGLTHQDGGRWPLTLLVAAAVAAAGWLAARTTISPRQQVPVPAAALVVSGAVLILVSVCIRSNGVSWFGLTHGAVLLDLAALVALSVPVLIAADRRLELLVAIPVTAAVLGAVDSIPAFLAYQRLSFWLGLLGFAVYLSGVAAAAIGRRVPQTRSSTGGLA